MLLLADFLHLLLVLRLLYVRASIRSGIIPILALGRRVGDTKQRVGSSGLPPLPRPGARPSPREGRDSCAGRPRGRRNGPPQVPQRALRPAHEPAEGEGGRALGEWFSNACANTTIIPRLDLEHKNVPVVPPRVFVLSASFDLKSTETRNVRVNVLKRELSQNAVEARDPHFWPGVRQAWTGAEDVRSLHDMAKVELGERKKGQLWSLPLVLPAGVPRPVRS